jgi:hypothetical protein
MNDLVVSDPAKKRSDSDWIRFSIPFSLKKLDSGSVSVSISDK